MKNLIIGIAGGSGSGKTTLALRLKERFGEDEVRLISHDSYYKRHDELPFEERCKLNYDHPDSFDTPLMIAHLRELRAGHAGQTRIVVDPLRTPEGIGGRRIADDQRSAVFLPGRHGGGKSGGTAAQDQNIIHTFASLRPIIPKRGQNSRRNLRSTVDFSAIFGIM